MDNIDELFTITCGKCGKTAPLIEWKPWHRDSTFQCPGCGYAFRRVRKKGRKPWEPFVELVEVEK